MFIDTTDKWKSWGGVLFIDGGYVYVWAGKLIGWGNFQDAFQTRFPINDFARFEWSTAQMYLRYRSID